jgi:hypothetical protein
MASLGHVLHRQLPEHARAKRAETTAWPKSRRPTGNDGDTNHMFANCAGMCHGWSSAARGGSLLLLGPAAAAMAVPSVATIKPGGARCGDDLPDRRGADRRRRPAPVRRKCGSALSAVLVAAVVIVAVLIRTRMEEL